MPPTAPLRSPRSGRDGASALVWTLGGLAAFTLAAALASLLLARIVLPDPSVTLEEPGRDAPAASAGEVTPSATSPTRDAATGEEAGFTVWATNDDGLPVRWDPCQPIEVVLAPRGAPPSAAADLDEALRRIEDASGLPLVGTGTTDERPRGDRSPYQPPRYGERWAPILVAWAAPGESGLPLRDTDRGIALPIAVGPEGDRTFVSAQVVLNRDRTDLEPGFGDRSDAWGATLIHELLHVLGLDHVDDPEQLMAVFPGSGPVTFGRGDLKGLAAIGAAAGCRPAPEPGPVRLPPPPPAGSTHP
ncbi:MAG: hypothetical protein ACLFUG_08235 [Nitriliruptoraceae bacterium]